MKAVHSTSLRLSRRLGSWLNHVMILCASLGFHHSAKDTVLSLDRSLLEASAPPRYGWAKPLWITLRPQQWIKNLFVLTPILFSQNLFTSGATLKVFLAFLLFCLISSSAYLLNDMKDLEQDRLHPVKRQRPLASGALGVRVAFWAMLVLLVLGLAGGLILSDGFAQVLFVYWLLNLLYTLVLKHHVILDVFAIAAGFVLRVIGGATVILVEMSSWLLICTTMLALFLGFSKRRHELTLLKGDATNHRQVLGEYNPHFLDMMIGIVTSITVLSYALYTVSEETIHKFQTKGLLFTLPFVLYGIFRYLYLVYHKGQGGDPGLSLVTDLPTMVNFFLWAITVVFVLY